MAPLGPHSNCVHLIIVLHTLVHWSCADPYREFFNNRVVVYHNETDDFFTAYETCQSENMQLLTIEEDIETWLLIHRMRDLKVRETWIAATDLKVQGAWFWTPTGTKITNIPWGTDQPDNLTKNQRCMCVDTVYDGWDDIDCGRVMTYFCQDTPKVYKAPIPVQRYLINGKLRSKISK